MSSTALTDRLNYLIEKGILGKIIGDKGAVFYAAAYIIHKRQDYPHIKKMIDEEIDNASPGDSIAILWPRNIKLKHTSDEEMSRLLVAAQQDWERVGVGSEREKEKVYNDLRRRRKELKRKAEKKMEDEEYDKE